MLVSDLKSLQSENKLTMAALLYFEQGGATEALGSTSAHLAGFQLSLQTWMEPVAELRYLAGIKLLGAF